MADIKTRDAVTGTIKAIDKSAVAAERMRDAFIRTKDEAQRGASPTEDSPEKYAADKVTSLAETAASRTAQEFDKQGRKAVQQSASRKRLGRGSNEKNTSACRSVLRETAARQ